ncbi:MAG: TonB-dependent receptor [Gammaproteobacteria bacterium]|nr:TonB-dependent receptor [Gammaproteobacteria bacterium]
MRRILQAMLVPGWGLLLLSAAVAAPGENEVAEVPIDEIVVVANRTERSIRDVAANVTVLSEEQFDAELAISMSDVLRYTPGIDYEGAGTRFGTEGFNIRGIGGNRVALLVDGVPLSDQFDVGSFSNATRDFVDAGFVQRAEVLHGPASALYGSSAIGGVVALRSPDPAHFTAGGTAGGSFGTAWRDADSSIHGTAIQALTGDRVGVLAGVSVRDGTEFDSAAADVNLDTRDYFKRSAMLKLVADDPLGNTWRLGYYVQDSEVTSSLTSMLGSGRFRSTTALEGDDSYRMDLLSGEFGFDTGWLDAGVVRAYYGATDVQQRTLDERAAATRPVAIDRLFVFDQTFRGVELNLQKNIDGERFDHRIGFGAEYRRRDTEEYRDGLETGLDDGLQTSVILGESFPLRDFPLSASTDMGVYLEDAVTAGNWTVIGALRADRYELDAKNDAMYEEDYPFAEPVSLSDAELSPKLGVIYRAGDTVDLYLQYSHGFRAPPYEDANIGLDLPLFNVRAIPNPDLRSESSDGLDAGIRWRGEQGSMHLSLFRTDYEDFIESKVRLGLDPVSGRILFQSQNVSEAVIKGVEAGGSVRIDRAPGELSIEGSFYWAHGENRDNGEPLNSVGPAQAVVGVNWSPEGGNWNTRLRATFTDGWSELDETAGELFEPHGYAVFDFYVTRRLGDHLRIKGGVTNLTDKTYWAWSDVRGLGPDDPAIPYLARPGRSVVLGVDMDW